MAAIEAVGLVSGALGIVSFLHSLLPEAAQPSGATVQIHVGLGEAADEGLGGSIGPIYTFDVNGSPLDRYEGGDSVDEGAAIDLMVNQDAAPGVDAELLSYTGDEGDKICISYMSVTDDPSGNSWAWIGDVRSACGQPSFAGNVVVNGDTGYRARCTWIGGTLGEDGGAISASFKVNMPRYSASTDDVDQIDPATACDNTQWSTDFAPIGKRSLPKRSAAMASRLMVSSHSGHSAAEECDNPLSYGPDFITLFGGVYCDMGTKIASPLCSAEVNTNCVNYDADKTSLRRWIQSVLLLLLARESLFGSEVAKFGSPLRIQPRLDWVNERTRMGPSTTGLRINNVVIVKERQRTAILGHLVPVSEDVGVFDWHAIRHEWKTLSSLEGRPQLSLKSIVRS